MHLQDAYNGYASVELQAIPLTAATADDAEPRKRSEKKNCYVYLYVPLTCARPMLQLHISWFCL